MFSASSSGISTSNSSSIAMTSSTMSRESAPRSSMKDEVALISSSPTPSWSAMMFFTFCSIVADMVPPPWFLVVPRSRAARTAARLHVHPAVDPQDLAGHVRCLIAREKSHRVRDVLRRAEPAERDHLHHLRLRRLREPGGHVRLDVARRHG